MGRSPVPGVAQEEDGSLHQTQVCWVTKPMLSCLSETGQGPGAVPLRQGCQHPPGDTEPWNSTGPRTTSNTPETSEAALGARLASAGKEGEMRQTGAFALEAILGKSEAQ